MKYHIERSISISAERSKVEGLIQDFNTWNSWSPWTMAEPDVKMTIEGNPGEPGHSMAWDGEVIGSGSQVLASVEDGVFSYDLTFLKPFKSKATTSFLVKEENGQTKVTWTMDSKMPFFLFFMVDMMKAWIEMDYDRGLNMMKAVAEKGGVSAKTTSKGVQTVEGFSYVGIERRASMEEMKEQMPKDFQALKDVLKKNGVWAKQWIGVYPKFHAKTREMTYIAACSDEELEGVTLPPEFTRGEIQSGSALEISHKGSFDFIGNAWSMGMMYVRAKKMKQKGAPYEYYWNNPMETPEEELKTSIYFPLK